MPRKNRGLITAGEPVAYPWLKAPDEFPNAGQDGEPVECTPVSHRKLRVLVADDNKDAADSLSVLLKLWGHDARVVYDGAAAMRSASADQPDVLLLDIAMPELNGYKLAEQLRHMRRFKQTLLIAITGFADDAHRRRGAAAGFDHYLAKPFELATLASLLLGESDRLAEAPGEFARVLLELVSHADPKPVGV